MMPTSALTVRKSPLPVVLTERESTAAIKKPLMSLERHLFK